MAVHRSLHTFERLWWFHAIHHDTPQMHITKSGRLYIGEEIFNAVLKPLPLLLLGAPPEIMVWLVFGDQNVTSRLPRSAPDPLQLAICIARAP